MNSILPNEFTSLCEHAQRGMRFTGQGCSKGEAAMEMGMEMEGTDCASLSYTQSCLARGHQKSEDNFDPRPQLLGARSA